MAVLVRTALPNRPSLKVVVAGNGGTVYTWCAVIMFDVAAPSDLQELFQHGIGSLQGVCEDIHTVLSSNKVNAENQQVKAKQAMFHRR